MHRHDQAGWRVISDRARSTIIAMAAMACGTASLAANDVSVAIDDCTGTRQTTTTPLPVSYLLECSDNLTLSNGVITSDVALVITSTNNLSLRDIRIEAPSILLRATSLQIGQGTHFVAAGGVLIVSTASSSAPPATSIASGSTISIDGASVAPIAASSIQLVAATSASSVSPNAGSITLVDDGSSRKSGGGALDPWVLLALAVAAAVAGLRSPRACRRSA